MKIKAIEISAMLQVPIFDIPINWGHPSLRPGVYFLLDELNSIQYVGQSVQPFARVHQHVREGKKRFVAAKVIPVGVDLLDAVEGALIRLLNPLQNGVSPTRTGRRVFAPRCCKVSDEAVLSLIGWPHA